MRRYLQELVCFYSLAAAMAAVLESRFVSHLVILSYRVEGIVGLSSNFGFQPLQNAPTFRILGIHIRHSGMFGGERYA